MPRPKMVSAVDRALVEQSVQLLLESAFSPAVLEGVATLEKSIDEFEAKLLKAKKTGKLDELLRELRGPPLDKDPAETKEMTHETSSEDFPKPIKSSRPPRAAAKKATLLNLSIAKSKVGSKLRRPSKLTSLIAGGTLNGLVEISEEDERPTKRRKTEEEASEEQETQSKETKKSAPKRATRRGRPKKTSSSAKKPDQTAETITDETDNEFAVPQPKKPRRRNRKSTTKKIKKPSETKEPSLAAEEPPVVVEATELRTKRVTRSTFRKRETTVLVKSSVPEEEPLDKTRSTFVKVNIDPAPCTDEPQPAPEIVVLEPSTSTELKGRSTRKTRVVEQVTEPDPEPLSPFDIPETPTRENEEGSKEDRSKARSPLSSEYPMLLPSKPATETKATEKDVTVPLFFSARKGSPFNTVNRQAVVVKPFEPIKVIKPDQSKLKQENQLRQLAKEENAIKKKQERIKAVTEETRRKREEKLQKVQALREVAEREKMEKLKLEKEKEERDRLLLEQLQKEKETKATKKKQAYTLKVKEVEERRLKEEQTRLQKIKDQEEEQARQEAQKKAKEEEMKKQKELAKANEALALEQEKKLLEECATELAAKKPKSGGNKKNQQASDDYGIEDISENESTDDESKPKKPIPKWAASRTRLNSVGLEQIVVPPEIKGFFMFCSAKTPNMEELLGHSLRKPRSSSAVWLHSMYKK